MKVPHALVMATLFQFMVQAYDFNTGGMCMLQRGHMVEVPLMSEEGNIHGGKVEGAPMPLIVHDTMPLLVHDKQEVLRSRQLMAELNADPFGLNGVSLLDVPIHVWKKIDFEQMPTVEHAPPGGVHGYALS